VERRPLRRRAGDAKRRLERRLSAIVAPVGFGYELLLALRARAQIAAFRERGRVIRRFADASPPPPPPRVVAVVTHVVDPERARGESVDRLARTLDGLLESLAHTQLELVVNTFPARHVVDGLPPYLRDRVTVSESSDLHPMLLGFKAQDQFLLRRDADWFIYLEDDLLLADPFLLEKLSLFNEQAPPGSLLLPHRYELVEGRKTYVDLASKQSPEWCPSSRLTVVDAGPWRFGEFENPHSGFYCLSQAQLTRWIESGRHWYARVSYVASRESAATGCLAEVFRLYKPLPENMTFLEVRHLDTKYSELYERLHGPLATTPSR
jgi:hypothetical protein